MKTVTFEFQKRFVSGTLKGMTFVESLTYPKSSEARVSRSFEVDVQSQRVIKGFGSAYQIDWYRVAGC